MPTLPKKLKHDAIVEAVFEIRFDPGAILPEVALGRLADFARWREYTAITRLPTADMPLELRLADATLLYTPLLDLRTPDGNRIVKIGTHTLQCATLKPYQGWSVFHETLVGAVDHLFASIPDINTQRLGLRYINIIEPEVHPVASISDLQISVMIGGQPLTDRFNLNFRACADEELECMVRVATKEFASPPPAGTGHTIIDIDAYTPSEVRGLAKDRVLNWLPRAREAKNVAFFNMFSREQIEKMQEE